MPATAKFMPTIHNQLKCQIEDGWWVMADLGVAAMIEPPSRLDDDHLGHIISLYVYPFPFILSASLYSMPSIDGRNYIIMKVYYTN